MKTLQLAIAASALMTLGLSAPAFAYSKDACVAAYKDHIGPETSQESLAAQCGCVDQGSTGNDGLRGRLDAVLAMAFDARGPAIDADAEMKALVDQCVAANP